MQCLFEKSFFVLTFLRRRNLWHRPLVLWLPGLIFLKRTEHDEGDFPILDGLDGSSYIRLAIPETFDGIDNRCGGRDTCEEVALVKSPEMRGPECE